MKKLVFVTALIYTLKVPAREHPDLIIGGSLAIIY
jgi:hypothetical protein